jgi:hypothetical protein
MGLAPALDHSPVQGDLRHRPPPERFLLNATCSAVLADGEFGAGLVPVRSPLLRESLLVSFPPLIYMLKFSGFSRLI